MVEPTQAALKRRERMREQEKFVEITEAILQLTPIQYATLRTWLLMQPTKADWENLMTS